MKEQRPPTRSPAARRSFCWGGGGRTPYPPGPPGGGGREGRGAKRGGGPRLRGWGHKEFGQCRLSDAELPHPPSMNRLETPGPRGRGAGRGERAVPRLCSQSGPGLKARVAGRQEASAAPEHPATPPPSALRQPGRAAGSPRWRWRPRRHTHPPPRPGREGSAPLRPAAAALPTPGMYLLIFWAKARRSAMAAVAAAAAAAAGRGPPRSRSLPRGLRQSRLRTLEAGAGRRSRNESCRKAP